MELAYRETGQGQPLLILHGLFGQSDNWNTLGKEFATRDLRVFTIDQRNHGLSPHSDTHSFEAMADDLSEFIKQHGLRDPILLGHSMGGKTVLYFEQRHSGMASKIVIADIAARKYEPHHQDILDALSSVDLNVIDNRREAEEVLSEKIADTGTRQFLLKSLHWKGERLNWRFNLDVLRRDYENVTAPVPFFTSDVPALIVRGERSRYVNDDDIADFKKRFSKCTIATIKDAGHWLHAEKPQPFFETVLAFIRS